MTTETLVAITADDIRTGVAGDCTRCAVARALQRATGDDDANVSVRDWVLCIEVWGRSIIAPAEVQRLVWSLDALPRDEDGRPVLPSLLDGTDCAPIAFTLPAAGDPAWEGECYECQELFSPAELDDESYCADCRADAAKGGATT